jgi:hypothetical protein
MGPDHVAPTVAAAPKGYLSRQLSHEAYAELELAERASVSDIGPPPDGGLRAWSVICSSSMGLFAVFGFGALASGFGREASLEASRPGLWMWGWRRGADGMQ